MDQSNRYADLSLREEELIRGGGHILVAYKMKPKDGHCYLEAAAHFAAESSIPPTRSSRATFHQPTRAWW